jgi:hypothetical protein
MTTKCQRWVLPPNFKTTFASDWSHIMAKQKKRKLRSRVTIKLTRAMASALQDRVESGLYGRTIEDVADRLLCESLRR